MVFPSLTTLWSNTIGSSLEMMFAPFEWSDWRYTSRFVCHHGMWRWLNMTASYRHPAIANHFKKKKKNTRYLNSSELRAWRSDEEQYSKEVLVFKALPPANGPQSILAFTHLAYSLTLACALSGVRRAADRTFRTWMSGNVIHQL